MKPSPITSQIIRLLNEILTAGDEAQIASLLARDADTIAALPPHRRERVNEQIADAIQSNRDRSLWLRQHARRA